MCFCGNILHILCLYYVVRTLYQITDTQTIEKPNKKIHKNLIQIAYLKKFDN